MKWMILAIALAVVSPAAMGQDNNNKGKQPSTSQQGKKEKDKPGDKPEKPKLPENQGQQVKDLNQDYHQRMKKIKDDPNLSKERKQEMLQEMNKDRAAKIKNITGSDDYVDYEWDRDGLFKDELKDEHKKDRGEGEKGKKGTKGEKGDKGGKGEKGEKGEKETKGKGTK